jgi:hypothetical protein
MPSRVSGLRDRVSGLLARGPLALGSSAGWRLPFGSSFTPQCYPGWRPGGRARPKLLIYHYFAARSHDL